MKVYERIENGTTTHVPLREGRDEIEAAQRGSYREIKSVSGGARGWFIDYRDGRRVKLVKVEAPEAPAIEVDEEPADLDVHVVSYLGGKVHTQAPGLEGHPWPLCRGGANQMLTKFRVTQEPLSCSHCVEYARRRAARAAR